MTYPKIGIRPTIDGRWGGVRESLETQTMNMAKAVKELFEQNLRYSNGESVKVIIRHHHRACTRSGGLCFTIP